MGSGGDPRERCSGDLGSRSGGDLDNGGYGRHPGLVQQKQHVVARRTDIAVGGRGDRHFVGAALEGENVDALVLIERMGHGWEANPRNLAMSLGAGVSTSNAAP